MKLHFFILGTFLFTGFLIPEVGWSSETSAKSSFFLSPHSDTLSYSNKINQSYAWVKSMQLKNGLIESAEGTDFVSLYDNALAALVFTLYNDRHSTEQILDFFNDRLATEFPELGGGFYQFRSADGTNAERKWMGDNAWLLLAIRHYEERFDSSKYRPMAVAIENWLRSLQDEDGGLWGGVQANGDRIHKITEGIITAFNAVQGYDDFHKGILAYLKNHRWDQEERLLLAWPENAKYKFAMDLHALGSLIYPSMSDQLLAKVTRFDTEQKASLNGKKISGFCFDEDRDVIWLEGTAQMALAFRRSGMEKEGLALLKEVRKTEMKSGSIKSSTGIPYAVNQGSNYGPEKLWAHADRKPAISSSAWYIFAMENFSPFEGNTPKHIPESDRFWSP